MLSALDLARRIEAGELTPSAVIDLCAQAIAARESDIGAFASLDLDGANDKAMKSADALRVLPLRGLPIAFKDIFDTADFPTAYGSTVYAGYRPRADASLVAMAKRAGGIVIGKTVSTEMAFLDPAGTRNPHNLAHTPGGSSSGSAASVAAGMTPIAIGTQTGGSVIRPASYCGVTGFKPSYRLLPMVGVKAFSWSLDTAGLFAATVADVAFAAAGLTGRNLRIDQGTSGAPRIALARTHIWNEASADMRSAVERAAEATTKAGANVREITLPTIMEDAFHVHPTLQNYEAARALAYEYDHHRDRLPKMLRALLDAANAISSEVYDDARRTTKRARKAYTDLMADFDVLLTPSATGAAPESLGSTGDAKFNRLWTLIGPPCVNVTGIMDSRKLPLGVQIVGRFGRDREALEAARFVEKAIEKHY